MNITKQRLLQIILEEISLMENFLKSHKGETVPLDDKVIKAILSLTNKKNLNEEMLSEDMKQRIRDLVVKAGDNAEAVVRVAKRLAIPAALVASIWGGAMTGAHLAGSNDSVSSGDNIEMSVQDDAPLDDAGLSDLAGTAYDAEQFHGMDNDQKLEAAWDQFDLNSDALDPAPVSSSVWIYKYAMIPIDQIDNNTIMPLIGASAADYYDFLKQRVEADPMTELPLLKKMVYGNVGKWAGGTGDSNQNFKVAEDGSQILPPDWTVAFTVYADIMEDKTLELVDYHIDNPEDRPALYQSLGVDSEAQFNEFVQSTLMKIGRPLEVR